MDPNLYHTLPGGIEVKIVDMLILFINIGVLGALLASYILFKVYKTIQDKKNSKKVLQIGCLTHLGKIFVDPLSYCE